MTIEERIAEAVRRALDEQLPRALERELRRLLPAAPPAPPAPALMMTPREVAARFKRDVSTVRRWAREGALRSKHINGRLLFDRTAVDAFEAAGGAPPSARCDDPPPPPNVVALRILGREG